MIDHKEYFFHSKMTITIKAFVFCTFEILLLVPKIIVITLKMQHIMEKAEVGMHLNVFPYFLQLLSAKILLPSFAGSRGFFHQRRFEL